MSFLTQRMTSLGDFEVEVIEHFRALGGGNNAHAHFCRALTLRQEYLKGFDTHALESASVLSLRQKQVLTGELHRGPAYRDLGNLEARMRTCLDDCILQGITEVTSCIDTTPDIGLSAINVAAKLRAEYAGKGLKFDLFAHPIFGFKSDRNHEKSRWDLFKEACEIADVVGALPEKDDRHDSVGYNEHLRRTLNLAVDLGKPFHAHVDQTNHPSEEGTLTLIEAVRWLGTPKVQREKQMEHEEPTVWAIHSISPASYDEAKFQRVLAGLKEFNIGVIVCPSAAMSMRQDRSVTVPMHNCIARVLEMAAARIPIRLGTDNLSDVFIPTYNSLLDEVKVLANLTRFYDVPVLATLAAGKRLNETNVNKILQHFSAGKPR